MTNTSYYPFKCNRRYIEGIGFTKSGVKFIIYVIQRELNSLVLSV